MNTQPNPDPNPNSETGRPRWSHGADTAIAACLAVMATSVFVNVVLRYGFGSGVAASEELSRLLFVWMVFIGATAAYPTGEHMAFTSLVAKFHKKPSVFAAMTLLIRLLVVLACAMLAWGAWQQVVVGMGSRSVVLGYPVALLPLPALLCAVTIGALALLETASGRPLDLGHGAEVE
jgi:TRAP-type transport system small permease protein